MEIYYDFIGFIVNIVYVLVGFNCEKFLRLTTSVGYIMHFPFPSVSHVSMGSGRDKVGIRVMVSLLIFGLLFLCLFLYYCGN